MRQTSINGKRYREDVEKMGLMKLARYVLPVASKIELSNVNPTIIWNEEKTYEANKNLNDH